MLRLEDYSFQYNGQKQRCLQGLNWEIRAGEHWALIGPNGSGKSTLARLLLGLERPDEGRLFWQGKELQSEQDIEAMRQHLALVFQNPDNQIVGASLEEDVAFGPENLGLPQPELERRVRSSLQRVALWERRDAAPSQLSGGQKQKLAIASALAMEPDLLIFDEACSMLDPLSARELFEFVLDLRAERGMSLINITHHMDEVLRADKVLVLAGGEAVFCGELQDFLQQTTLHKRCRLTLPFAARLWLMLPPREQALLWPYLRGPEEEFRAEVARHLPNFQRPSTFSHEVKGLRTAEAEKYCRQERQAVLSVQDLSFRYPDQESGRPDALRGISFDLKEGEILAILGQSGSGKSTLMTCLNGLLKPRQGEIRVGELSSQRKEDLASLRRKVGLVFQYPEYQLFEASVADDIAFGPRQLGQSSEAVLAAVERAMAEMDLTADLATRAPFQLSGGQQRRVAIAGVLAIEPDILLLDEPLAGLDPEGRQDLLRLFRAFCQRGGSIIFVTHNMPEALAVSDRLAVLHEGCLRYLGGAEALFEQTDLLTEASLLAPTAWHWAQILARHGLGASKIVEEEALIAALAASLEQKDV